MTFCAIHLRPLARRLAACPAQAVRIHRKRWWNKGISWFCEMSQGAKGMMVSHLSRRMFFFPPSVSQGLFLRVFVLQILKPNYENDTLITPRFWWTPPPKKKVFWCLWGRRPWVSLMDSSTKNGTKSPNGAARLHWLSSWWAHGQLESYSNLQFIIVGGADDVGKPLTQLGESKKPWGVFFCFLDFLGKSITVLTLKRGGVQTYLL